MKQKSQLIIILTCFLVSCSTKSAPKEAKLHIIAPALENQPVIKISKTEREPISPPITDSISMNKDVDTKLVQHKTKTIALTKKCSFEYEWDEVVLSDKTVESKINNEIRSIVEDFISRGLTESDEVEKSYCKGEDDYNFKSEIVYAQSNLIRCYVYHYTYGKGAAHGWSSTTPLNFNARTGEIINFREFIDEDKIQNMNALLVHSLHESYEEFADIDQEELAEQLADIKFKLSNKGVTFIINGSSYVSSNLDLFFTYKELEPFLKKEVL